MRTLEPQGQGQDGNRRNKPGPHDQADRRLCPGETGTDDSRPPAGPGQDDEEELYERRTSGMPDRDYGNAQGGNNRTNHLLGARHLAKHCCREDQGEGRLALQHQRRKAGRDSTVDGRKQNAELTAIQEEPDTQDPVPKTYAGFKNVDGLTGTDLKEAQLSHNSQWMRERINEGRQVIDIGPAETRANYPGVTSDSYSVELYELEAAGYTNIIQPYDYPISIGVR